MAAETQTVDLAAWLTAVWDEEEAMATGMFRAEIGSFPSPRQTLARIAADRKILALHTGGVSFPDECGLCNEPLPCETVRLQASPHADRPDFRSEWLVERQGVEG